MIQGDPGTLQPTGAISGGATHKPPQGLSPSPSPPDIQPLQPALEVCENNLQNATTRLENALCRLTGEGGADVPTQPTPIATGSIPAANRNVRHSVRINELLDMLERLL